MSRIQVVGTTEHSEKQIAVRAAMVKAKVCMDGCPKYQGGTATVSVGNSFQARKVTPDFISVRVKCECEKNPVRPPVGVAAPADCPLRKRAEEKARRMAIGPRAA